MEQAYCIILFTHILRITWILAASEIILGTSADFYERQLMAKADSKLVLDPNRENKMNENFTFRYIAEIILLILFNQYFYRVA